MPGQNARYRFDPGEIADEQEFAEIYRELRIMARRMRARNLQETISTTALVHECWLRLERADGPYNERDHYLFTAARAMRQILVDYARYRGAAKRNREREMPLIEFGLEDESVRSAEEILALDQALTALEELDERSASLVLLRFYAGVTIEESARILDISPRSAARDWKRARAFLKSRLSHP